MSNVLRFRLVAVLFFLISLHVTLPGQIFRNLPRRVERQAVAASSADAKIQLQRLTNDIKANPRKIAESDLIRSQRLLLDAVNDLQRRLPREFNRAEANDWNTTFQLAELKATLTNTTPDPAILEAVQNAFYSDKEGVRWITFEPLGTALRRYQTVAQMLEDNRYERRLNSVCDNLVNFIELYTEGRDPGYFVALSEAVIWLDDISFIEPRAARLAELTRIACAGVNLRLQVGSDLLAAGFQRTIDEELDIDEMILKSKVVGSGTLSGSSTAELVSASNRVIIRVLADTVMETHTDGSQSMVTLKNHTTGTLRGEKQILLSADAVTTTPARSRANLQARLSDVRINAGPLLRLVARSQIEPRSEDSLEEAALRAERRMNRRMNDQIDPKVAELNEKYQKIRDMLIKTGLFPRVWNLSSTPQRIDWSILLGNSYQPSAPTPAPALNPTNGLAVQVHQSALNNMLAIALSGRMIDEERLTKRIEEFMDETPEFLQRKSEETPAKVSFGRRAPVDVLFMDNKVRVVIRLNDIQVMDSVARSFTISVEYQIKMESLDGQGFVILEQTEAEALPTGFNPESGATLSATQTIIRSYLMRRLEALPKRQEAKVLDLGG